MSSEAKLLREPLGAVVVGPDLLASALAAQGVPVRRVDWRPPSAAGDLASLWCEAVDSRIGSRSTVSSPPMSLNEHRAGHRGRAGHDARHVLHAGPPIAGER